MANSTTSKFKNYAWNKHASEFQYDPCALLQSANGLLARAQYVGYTPHLFIVNASDWMLVRAHLDLLTLTKREGCKHQREADLLLGVPVLVSTDAKSETITLIDITK